MGSIEKPTSFSNDKILIFVPAEPNVAWIKKIQGRYPGLRVEWLNNLKDGELMSADDIPADVWEGVTIYSSFLVPPASAMANVRYVQLTSAGVDKWLDHDVYRNEDVTFCSANGVHGPQIAEWVISTWLAHQHTLWRYHDLQKQAVWKRLQDPVQDSVNLRMGILGYGAIGRQVGRLGQALGMDVLAYTRSQRATPESRKDDSYWVPGTGDPDGLIPSRWFHGASAESVNDFLAQDFDLLVVGLPLTVETRGLLGKEQFDILSKKKTFVSNIARGGLVQQGALVEALEEGKIRGAALDVTDPEPLPEGHELFKAPNVFITPHVSGLTTAYWDRCLDILEQNMEKMDRGDEKLINVINRTLNY